MRMFVEFRFLALALVLLLLVAPAIPSRAALLDETTEGAAADDAEMANAALEDDASYSFYVMLLDPRLCMPVEQPARIPATPAMAASPVAEIDPDLWDYAEGVQLTDAAQSEPVGAARVFLSCSNAGNAPAALTRVTGSYPGAHGGAAETATPGARTMPVDALLGLIDIPGVREHETGQVVVFFEIEDPGYCERNVIVAFVFQKVADLWLIEAIADVTNDAPVPYRPPVFRESGASTCRSNR